MTLEQILGTALGSSGVAAVMYLWIRALQGQLKDERDERKATSERVLKLAEAQAATAQATRERLQNIEYALGLRKTLRSEDSGPATPAQQAPI